MKKSGFKILLNTGLVILMLVSCDNFVPDPIDPRLPIYSEVGRNIAGAKVGNQFFKNDLRPLLLSSNQNESQYFQEGDPQLILNFRVWNQNQSVFIRFTFELNELTIEDWDEMEKGFGKKFVFNDKYKATISEWEKDDYISVPFEGQVTVKLLKGEKVVAGTFGFKGKDTSGREIMVTYGRFDYQYFSF